MAVWPRRIGNTLRIMKRSERRGTETEGAAPTTGRATARDRLTVIRAQLFGSAFVLVQHLGRRMDGLLTPMGVTTRQWLLLAVLSRSDQPLSLTEAAARYGSSRQNVKSIALGLERAGYLCLEPDPADARTIRLHLRDTVRRFDEPAVAAQGSAFLAEVFAGLDADDLAVLDELMRRWLTSAASEAASALGLAAATSKPVTTKPATTTPATN
jgi:DNA-binding MarR family transcriptional regulator